MIVDSSLTVGALRRVLAGLDGELPVGAIRLLAMPESSIGRIDAAEVVEVHVSHREGTPAAVWLWCRADPSGVTTPRSDLPLPAILAASRPDRVLVARSCGCIALVPIEHELVHLDAQACAHQPAAGVDLYRGLVRHARDASDRS